jgi:hypothetical protein
MTESPKEPEKRACAVCARPLHSVVPEGGGEPSWVHAEMEWEDHPAVPVAQDEIHVEYKCDFCSADNPAWVLPSRPFDSGEFTVAPGTVVDTMQGENFSCCDTCARLIETNQWNGLVRRVAGIMGEKHGFDPSDEVGQAVTTGLKDFYRKLRKNITGGIRPLKEGE